MCHENEIEFFTIAKFHSINWRECNRTNKFRPKEAFVEIRLCWIILQYDWNICGTLMCFWYGHMPVSREYSFCKETQVSIDLNHSKWSKLSKSMLHEYLACKTEFSILNLWSQMVVDPYILPFLSHWYEHYDGRFHHLQNVLSIWKCFNQTSMVWNWEKNPEEAGRIIYFRQLHT